MADGRFLNMHWASQQAMNLFQQNKSHNSISCLGCVCAHQILNSMYENTLRFWWPTWKLLVKRRLILSVMSLMLPISCHRPVPVLWTSIPIWLTWPFFWNEKIKMLLIISVFPCVSFTAAEAFWKFACFGGQEAIPYPHPHPKAVYTHCLLCPESL